MAAIETTVSQLPASAPEIGGSGRGRSRYQAGRGRGGGTPRNDRDPDESALLEQEQAGGRQRARRTRGHRGEGQQNTSFNPQDSSPARQGQLNPSEHPSTGPRPPRQRNKRPRGNNGNTVNESAGQQSEQSQQLNWQQQLLLENSQQAPRNSSGSSRGGRGSGRGGGQQPNRNRRQAPDPSSTPGPAPRNDRSYRGRITAPRGFGAQLTVSEPASAPTTTTGTLRPDASPFEPRTSDHPGDNDTNSVAGSSDTGNWNTSEAIPTKSYQPSRKAQAVPAKSVKEAEDLMSRIHDDIASGNYECMICYGGVTRKSLIWDCGRCFAVFHLKCIQKWAKQGLDAPLPPNALENGEDRPRTWRCPGCQNPDTAAPSVYECWCGKTQNPETQRYIAAHSCGQPCGKERTSPRACPHPCSLQCHAGPCPPCTAMGPVQACFCGKESTQRRCLDTDYENGWSCQQICEDFMPCGEHTCPRPCHSGLCGDCEFEEELSCYCGKKCINVKCYEKSTPMKSMEAKVTGTIEWIGHWSCKTECDRFFDCGNHKCSKTCHPVDLHPAHCPLSPDKITHCPCGKTELSEILSSPRHACLDPIPSCKKICNKTLKCGHKCQQTCHTDECGVCLQTVEINCRCGRVSSTSICHQGANYEPPQCMRTCRVMLNCQRHECGEKCCSGESAAIERITTSKKKKQRPLNSAPIRSDEGYEPEHICTRPCGKLLKCGKHTCAMLCHRGPCGTCLEASFEELTCNCGRTVVHPPVPCGSRPPQCSFDCTRQKTCGHPPSPHNCHTDEQPCPKCPYLTVKRCVCGKKDIKNQPCWREAVTCGTICGKKLSCGSHTCKKVCHKDGECEEPCTQPCGKLKSCGHMDADSCHAPFQCTETTPCQSTLQISCACGGIKQEVKCNATRSSLGNKDKEIKCNDTCRARRMALALQIDPDRETADKMGYSDETIEMYNELPKQFSQTVEKALRTFAEAPQKRYAFQPMKSHLRQFIHLLATDYGLESESQDPEPYRSVVVMKGPKFTTAPKKSITEFIRASAKSSALNTHASSPAPTPLIEQLRKPGKQAVNAIVLEGIRVGLLMNELEKELDTMLGSSPLKFSVHWTADEEVVLEPKPSSLGMSEIETELANIKIPLRRTVKAKGLAQDVELCCVGKDGKIIHKENQKWATVVGPKGSSTSGVGMTTVAPSPWGGKPGISISQNGFGALDPYISSSSSRMTALGGSRSSESLREKERKEKERKEREKEKKKRLEEEIVDDWEAAADEEEARSIQAEGSVKDEEEVGSHGEGGARGEVENNNNLADDGHKDGHENVTAALSSFGDPQTGGVEPAVPDTIV